jgi:chlorite dismutase
VTARLDGARLDGGRDEYVHALALGVDPAWRRLEARLRTSGARELAAAVAGGREVTSRSYSSIGLRAGVDILVWSSGPTLDALEERAAAVLRSGLGRWMTVTHSFLGVMRASPYARRAATASFLHGNQGRYLVVYPFTKCADWYQMALDARQEVMTEHMQVGHRHGGVRQVLANSFGLDDMDFLVAYETDDLAAFSDLVRALRETESRRWTVRDTPILAGVRRPLSEIAALLGATELGVGSPGWPSAGKTTYTHAGGEASTHRGPRTPTPGGSTPHRQAPPSRPGPARRRS